MNDIATGTPQLLCQLDDGIATVTLNRPEKRNALSDELTPALRSILLDLEDNNAVRCIVITGAGGAFCSGGDVSQMGGNQLAESEVRSFEEKIRNLQHKQKTLTLRLHELSKPTIAAIPGAAAGAGFAIALACDFRIAAKSAFMTTGYGRIGLSGDYGASWFLTRLVGPSIAMELFFSSRRVTAEEAARLGIVNHCVPDDEYDQRVTTFAEDIASAPPIAVRYMKSHINRSLDIDLATLLDLEAEHLLRCAQTDDHREAVSAFMEKRAPSFRGR